VNPAALADGTYTAQARQSDAGGNTGFSSTLRFTLDQTPPDVTLSLPATFNTSRPALTGTAGTADGDASSVVVSIYPGTTPTGTPRNVTGFRLANGTFQVFVVELADGTWTAVARQQDDNGNVGESAPQTFVVDTVRPAPTLNATPPNIAASTVTFTGTGGSAVGDNGSVVLKLLQGPTLVRSIPASLANGAYSITVDQLPDGFYSVWTEQTDLAGNTGMSTPRGFQIDTAAPVVTLTSPAGAVATARPTFAGSAGKQFSDLTAIRVDIYAGPTPTGTPITVTGTAANGAFSLTGDLGLADGTYTAVARQDDVAGNHGASAPRTFAIDTVAPAPTLAAPAALNPAELSGTGDDGHVVLTLSREGTVVRTLDATVSQGAFSASLSALADGAYTVTAAQEDAAGNHGASAPQSFRVDTTAPEIDAGAIRASYALGESAATGFACTDGGSGVAACDGPAAVDTASAGDHELVVTARDRAGNARTVHVRYTVLAPAVTPQAPPPAPVTPQARPKPALTIAAPKLKRHGHTLTLTLRGTGSGISTIKLTATGVKAPRRTASARLVGGAWKATMKLKVKGALPKRFTLTATAGGISVKRTVRVR
jgi:hypothetical protein